MADSKVKLVKPFNIDRFMAGKLKDRINLIGVELEGGWTNLPSGVKLVHDGSVQVPQPAPDGPPEQEIWQEIVTLNAQGQQVVTRVRVPGAIANGAPTKKKVGWQTGEYPSEPMEVKAVGTWLTAFYPSHVNDTCGLHVHMSFKKALHYQKLMIPEYQATVIEYLKRWAKEEGFPSNHSIWARLDGKSTFCKQEFFPAKQVLAKNKIFEHNGEGNRYTCINYCYGQHSTIECRVLPMMEKAPQAIRAVERVLRITNATLASLREKEPREIADVTLGNEGYMDERTEVVI